MGVTAPARTGGGFAGWLGSRRGLRQLAIASLIANVAIVVTGGAVRVTNSGLGCPTWPRCTDHTLTPTKAAAIHGVIEFTNRQLTFVLGVLALLTLVSAYRQRREVRLAALGLASIPAQAVLGGITVLTDLNPYAVASHLLFSMAVIALYAVLVWRVVDGRPVSVPMPVRYLAGVITAAAALVLTFGTIVTGTGPHAGDLKAGRLHRIHLSPESAAQLHADAVWILIGASVGMVAFGYLVGGVLLRAAWLLLGVELAQGAIGYTQYFLHVPAGLVLLHMLGASLVWLAALRVLLLVTPRRAAAGVTTPG
jgi:cytochrome c oxidase assembly protein subunit 15